MKRLIFAACLVVFLATVRSPGAVYVLAPDGTTIATTPTVGNALALATNRCTVMLDPGIYSAASGESFPLRITNALTLVAAAVTNPLGATLQGDSAHTVLLIESPGVTVRGLRITSGLGSEGIYGMDGGGICIFVDQDASGSVLIADCRIENNKCAYDETYNGCGGGIYCGGTWCTCFEIGILNTVIRSNNIPGNGGAIFCGMLSRVWMEGCTFETNSANDRGGALFVDNYGLAMLKASHVRNNSSPGDPSRAGWGGKGGGLFLNGEAVCAVTDCDITGNTAVYYGGGLFTMSGVAETATGSECSGAAHQFFTMPVLSNVVSGSLLASNNAGRSGGGAYIRDHAFLAFRGTTNYWNNAVQDGGGVCVSGAASGGGKVDFSGQSLLEGNECAGRGAGVFLGMSSLGTMSDTRFLGNSSGGDGGALFLDSATLATLTNCLVTYNNAARGYGGGLRLLSGARATLLRSSVVGSFAPWGHSGCFLDANASLNITNSILWRNAGGSVETNGGTVNIAYSLDEDGPAPLTGNPDYVGWGTNTDIYVSATAGGSGAGTSNNPFCNLQVALDGFDFQLAGNSACRTNASDGGFIGANTGTGGTAGNVVAALHLDSGTYDIRGRNIIFTRGLQGNGSTNSAFWNAVFGYVEDTFIRDLAITGETMFGGIVTRANARFERCQVARNSVLADGGGIYVAQGQCLLTNTLVWGNQSTRNGGGIFLATNTMLTMDHSSILANSTISPGSGYGGGVYASAFSSLLLTNSTLNPTNNTLVANNGTPNDGGGLYLEANTTTMAASSDICTNTANGWGAGVYGLGTLNIADSQFIANSARVHAGALFLGTTATGTVTRSTISLNYAGDTSGGILSYGATTISQCLLSTNQSGYGTALQVQKLTSNLLPVLCENSQFLGNTAWGDGGAVRCWENTAPVFTGCDFTGNRAWAGGAAEAWDGSHPTFDLCSFTGNSAGWGGAFYWRSTSTLALNCGFTNNTASQNGGALRIEGTDQSRIINCVIVECQASLNGGGVAVGVRAHPLLQDVTLVNDHAFGNGGGIACSQSAYPYFTGVVISNCSAMYGGGVYASDSTISTFSRSKFERNSSWDANIEPDGGGAFFTSNAVARLAGCWLANNTTKGDGAGLTADGHSQLSLTNVYMVNNQATNTGGGAKFNAYSSGVLQNCTIMGNRANSAGGGAGVYSEDHSSVTIDSCIIYGNQVGGLAQSALNTTVNWSCLQEPWPGIGNTDVNPLVDPTGFFLLDGSPCIDAGNPSINLNDAAHPPGKGTASNDMGATGGPLNGWTPGLVSAWWIPSGAVWKYYDRGQLAPGADWRTAACDDRDWLAGATRLGFGNNGELTTVSNATTVYFRRAFTVNNAAALTALEAHLIRDDGAVVWLNGVEIFRSNMPAGTVGYATLASSCATGADESRWFTNAVDPAKLVEGTNILAVEIHLCAPNDSDLGFDFELVTPPSVVRPVLAQSYSAGSGTLNLSFGTQLGQSYSLYGSTNLASWNLLTNWIGNGAPLQLAEPVSSLPACFFQLRSP